MSNEISLHSAKQGYTYNVSAVPELELLKSLGIRAGASLRVICRYPLGGPTLVCIEDSSTVAVGKDISTLVFVTPDADITNDAEGVA